VEIGTAKADNPFGSRGLDDIVLKTSAKKRLWQTDLLLKIIPNWGNSEKQLGVYSFN
jgi:hypothetical protein